MTKKEQEYSAWEIPAAATCFPMTTGKPTCPKCGDPIDIAELMQRDMPVPEPAPSFMDVLQGYHNNYAAMDNNTRTAFRIMSNWLEKHVEVKR